jgi:hypothetical protein
VEIRPIDAGASGGHAEDHGFGLFVKKNEDDAKNAEESETQKTSSAAGAAAWLFGGGAKPVVLASVPMRLAVSADAAANHDTPAGAVFREMLESGEIDERLAVMLLLIVERRRGEGSPIKAYVDALPKPGEHKTPLFYDANEMKALRGTNLHRAVSAQRRRLASVLKDSAIPAGKKLMRAVASHVPPEEREKKTGGGWLPWWLGGGNGKRDLRRRRATKPSAKPITMDEFLWAYATFWSRALALPIGPDPEASGAVEAIVPGIDFANHSCARPNARWAVANASGREGATAGEPTVTLECLSVPGPGEEVLISYGDKPNEELLFVHGFAERENPHDALVLHPHWMKHADDDDDGGGGGGGPGKKTFDETTAEGRAAAELDAEVRGARLTLSRVRGIPLQVILPQHPPPGGLKDLPTDVVRTLEVWGFTPEALEAELHASFGGAIEGNEEAAKAGGVRGRPDAAARKTAAIEGLKLALEAQNARMDAATGMGGGGGGGAETSAPAGSRKAIAAAVAAASSRRVDEVVAADPLAPAVARQAAVYRSGVARMTRRYVDEVSKWR